jgi:hypothetical protein
MAIIKNQHGESETTAKNGRPKKTKSGVKINNKTGKAETGRPPLIPEEATRQEILNTEEVKKLVEAFKMDYNETEACAYAKITWATFKKYKDQNPEFLSIIEDAKSTTARLARTIIFTKIGSGDEKVAQWYLERKRRNEFATKTVEEQVTPAQEPTSLTDVDLSNLTDQELDQFTTFLEKVKVKETDQPATETAPAVPFGLIPEEAPKKTLERVQEGESATNKKANEKPKKVKSKK